VKTPGFFIPYNTGTEKPVVWLPGCGAADGFSFNRFCVTKNKNIIFQ
jgi:hypothetical protein